MSITPAPPPAFVAQPHPVRSNTPNLLLGLLLGTVLGGLAARAHYQPKILEQAMIAGTYKTEVELLSAERREWVTVMVEPGVAAPSLPFFGMLGTYLGGPAGSAIGSALDQAGTERSPEVFGWGVPGKVKPMSRKPGVSFIWLNQRTGQKLGPFQPATNPEAP